MSQSIGKTEGKTEILVQSSRFRGTNGIAWGPDHLIWMGSVWSGTLVAIDPESGETRHVVDAAKGADDLAFHPDGRMFWNDIGFGEIGCRIPNGKTSIVANIGAGNNGMAVSKDGRLFVSQLFMGSKLYEIDPDGKRPPREVADLGKQMSNAMNFGPDGKLYGSAWATGEVTRIDIETGAVEVVASNVGIPSSVKFCNEGKLHVLNIKEGVVSKVNIDTGELERVAQLPFPGTDNMCFSPDNRLFVSSAADGYLWEVTGEKTQRVLNSGRPWSDWRRGTGRGTGTNQFDGGGFACHSQVRSRLRPGNQRGQGCGHGDKVIEPRVVVDGLDSPQGLAFDNGRLLAVEAGAGKLLAIDLSSGKSTTLADGLEFGTGPLAFQNMPRWGRASVAVSANTVYIAGTKNAVIYKVTL